jgi:dTDP-4-dehydrorhamnose reductase
VKVLLTGAAGQLGQALRASRPKRVELIATSRSGGSDIQTFDLADAEVCQAAVLKHQPDWVLNADSYTAEDKAESVPNMALAVNGGAPRAFTEAVLNTGARILQLSTEFVFNGESGTPYQPDQEHYPLWSLWAYQGRMGRGGGRTPRR